MSYHEVAFLPVKSDFSQYNVGGQVLDGGDTE